jgi:hypothetical protein
MAPSFPVRKTVAKAFGLDDATHGSLSLESPQDFAISLPGRTRTLTGTGRHPTLGCRDRAPASVRRTDR